MLTTKCFDCLVVVTLYVLHLAFATPTPQVSTDPINPAVLVSYIDCSPEQESKLRGDLNDAFTIAHWTSDYPIDLNSLAWVSSTVSNELD